MYRWMKIMAGAAALLLLLIVFWGCSEENPAVIEQPREFRILKIIVDPLSPKPGETVTLTVQSDGTAPAGEFPTYEWSVGAGTLVGSSGMSVYWTAPETAGLVDVSVSGKLASITTDLSKKVAIRSFKMLQPNIVMNSCVKPTFFTAGLVYLGTDRSPWDPMFQGWKAYMGGVLPDQAPDTMTIGSGLISDCNQIATWPGRLPCYNGDFFKFYPEKDEVLGSMFMQSQIIRQRAMDVCIFRLVPIGKTGNPTRDTGGVGNRRNQHVHADMDEDITMVTWQQNIVGISPDGTRDLFNIGWCGNPFVTNPTVQTLTTSVDSARVVQGPDTNTVYYFWRNIKPMFTPDNEFILFFTDKTGVFEPAMIPMVAGQPDTNQRYDFIVDPVREVGLFEHEQVRVSENTVFEWNPVSNTLLAFIEASDGYLCFFEADTLAPTLSVISILGRVSEFVWAPDGSECAVITREGVDIVTLAGNSANVFLKEDNGDDISGLNYAHSMSEPKLAFRIGRYGQTPSSSFTALVVLDLLNDEWYYASKDVIWPGEPTDIPFPWMRVVFESDDVGIVAPFPVIGNRIKLYRSFESDVE